VITCGSRPIRCSLFIWQGQKSCVYFVLQGLRFVSIMFLDGLCVLLGTVRGKELARTVRMGELRRQCVPSGLLLHATASVWRWLGQGRLLSAPCVAPFVVAKAEPGLLVGSVRGMDLARNVCVQAPFVVATDWPGLAALRHLSWMGLLCSSLGPSMALVIVIV